MRAFFNFYFFNFCQASIKKGATDVGSSVSLRVISNARFLCILTGMLNVSVLQSQSRQARVKRCACMQLPQLKVSDVKNYSFFFSLRWLNLYYTYDSHVSFPPFKKRLHLWQHTQNAGIAHNKNVSLRAILASYLLLCYHPASKQHCALLGLRKISFFRRSWDAAFSTADTDIQRQLSIKPVLRQMHLYRILYSFREVIFKSTEVYFGVWNSKQLFTLLARKSLAIQIGHLPGLQIGSRHDLTHNQTDYIHTATCSHFFFSLIIFICLDSFIQVLPKCILFIFLCQNEVKFPLTYAFRLIFYRPLTFFLVLWMEISEKTLSTFG